ncbi:MAG: 30S ribosomal protein S13 [Candidatus Hermodarchaeota archaeon]
MSLTTRPSNFREKVFFRKLRSQVDGNSKVEYGLTQIRGIGRRFAQTIVRIAEINPNMRIGAIPEKDLNRLEEIILDPIANGVPEWMVNRKNDLVTGENLHIIGNKLELSVKRDIDRMKRIRSYKGVRHHQGLKVRGQRTKSTGRHGLVVGVVRKKKGQK